MGVYLSPRAFAPGAFPPDYFGGGGPPPAPAPPLPVATADSNPCVATAEDWLAVIRDLHPPGLAHEFADDSVRGRFWLGVAVNMLRLQDFICDFLQNESFPGTAVAMLPDWEKALGLPDPCVTDALTIPQRQAACIARLAGGFDPTPANFIALAAQLGFTITITQFPATRFGARFGSSFARGYRFWWQVNGLANPRAQARFGSARFGDRFATFGNTLLECTFERLKPAHTGIIFNYSG
jgi:uncharacterized protein YmfQ (DUF2313 family)